MNNNNGLVNSREELISMILGLGVVLIAVVIIVNFIVRSKGSISVPGISLNTDKSALTTPGLANNSGSNEYEVKKGDTLWKISEDKYKTGYMWTKIANANNLKNASLIEVGQKLILPDISSDEINAVVAKIKMAPVAPVTHVVVRGESLWTIASTQLGDGYKWTQIWNLNKKQIVNPNKLEIGMILKLR
jgi:nucleoid-associated protein YgaU